MKVRKIATFITPSVEDSPETVEALQNGIRAALASFIAESDLFGTASLISVDVIDPKGEDPIPLMLDCLRINLAAAEKTGLTREEIVGHALVAVDKIMEEYKKA